MGDINVDTIAVTDAIKLRLQAAVQKKLEAERALNLLVTLIGETLGVSGEVTDIDAVTGILTFIPKDQE